MTFQTITLLPLLILIWSHAFAQNNYPKDSLICWQENTRLKWVDFQSPENLADKNYSSDAADASTASGVIVRKTSKDGVFEYKVSVLFYKSESWVRDSSTMTPILLIHEQAHFDLSELFGRKIRLTIAQACNSKKESAKLQLDDSIKNLIVELDKYQSNYDKDTDNGRVTLEQSKWLIYIKTELTKLSSYKSTANSCWQ